MIPAFRWGHEQGKRPALDLGAGEPGKLRAGVAHDFCFLYYAS